MAVNKMLFFKIEQFYHPQLKTFLVYLERMPLYIEINNTRIISSEISVDLEIAKVLRNI